MSITEARTPEGSMVSSDWLMSVLTRPGSMAKARTPVSWVSASITLVRRSSAALLAQ